MAAAREEFFGPSRETAEHKFGGRLELFVLLPFGIFFGTMKLWGSPPQSIRGVLLLAYWFSPFIGLAMIIYAIQSATKAYRLAGVARPDSVWYTISDAGLQYPDIPSGDLTVAWSSMKRFELVPGNPPKVKLTNRYPLAKIDRTLTLRADLRSTDGATFGDRMREWYEAKAAAGETAAASA